MIDSWNHRDNSMMCFSRPRVVMSLRDNSIMGFRWLLLFSILLKEGGGNEWFQKKLSAWFQSASQIFSGNFLY